MAQSGSRCVPMPGALHVNQRLLPPPALRECPAHHPARLVHAHSPSHVHSSLSRLRLRKPPAGRVVRARIRLVLANTLNLHRPTSILSLWSPTAIHPPICSSRIPCAHIYPPPLFCSALLLSVVRFPKPPLSAQPSPRGLLTPQPATPTSPSSRRSPAPPTLLFPPSIVLNVCLNKPPSPLLSPVVCASTDLSSALVHPSLPTDPRSRPCSRPRSVRLAYPRAPLEVYSRRSQP